jgi:hypothetical protein
VIAVNVGSPPLPPEDDRRAAEHHRADGRAAHRAERQRSRWPRWAAGHLHPARPGRHHGGRLRPPCRGRRARPAGGRALAERLRRCRWTSRYAAWRQRMSVRERALPRVDEIQIAGTLRSEPPRGAALGGAAAGPAAGHRALGRDLLRAYGDGWYERVDYSVYTTQRGPQRPDHHAGGKELGPGLPAPGRALRVQPGPGLQLPAARRLPEDLAQRPGGELLFNADLGSTTGVSADWYQPLTRDHARVCRRLQAGCSERTDYFLGKQRVAQYSAAAPKAVSAGPEPAAAGPVAAGLARDARQRQPGDRASICWPAAQRIAGRAGCWRWTWTGWTALYFPAKRLGPARGVVGCHAGRAIRALTWKRACASTWGDWVLGGRASWVGSPAGELPVFDAARLGGFLNLTGLCQGPAGGRRGGYAHLRGERIIGRCRRAARRHAPGPGAGGGPRGPSLHAAAARHALAAADAHRHQRVAAAGAVQLVQRLGGDEGARAADRVAQRDGAAVRVGLLMSSSRPRATAMACAAKASLLSITSIWSASGRPSSAPAWWPGSGLRP